MYQHKWLIIWCYYDIYQILKFYLVKMLSVFCPENKPDPILPSLINKNINTNTG